MHRTNMQRDHGRESQSQTAVIEQIRSRVDDLESDSDMFKSDSSSENSRSPQTDCETNQEERTKRGMKECTKKGEIPTTQYVIGDCTPPKPSTSNNQSPDRPIIEESISAGRESHSQAAIVEHAHSHVGDLVESDSDMFMLYSNPESSRSQQKEWSKRGKTGWMKMREIPMTQYLIQDYTPPPPSTSNNQTPDRPIIEESISPAFSRRSDERESNAMSPIIGRKRLKRMFEIETIAEVPSTQIEIDDVLSSEKVIVAAHHSAAPFIRSSDASNSLDLSTNVVNLNIKSEDSKFTKSGYAAQAMKAVKAQRMSTEIWEFERIQYRQQLAEGSTLDLVVRDEIVEYDRYILVCANPPGVRSGTSLVLLGADERTQPINILKGRRIRLFPPYLRKYIDYQGCFSSFYYNVVRCEVADDSPDTKADNSFSILKYIKNDHLD